MLKELHNQLEKIKRSRSYYKDNIGLPNSISKSTLISRAQFVDEIPDTNKYSDVQRNLRIEKIKNIGTCTTDSEFCLPNVFSEKTRRQQQANFQSKKFKSVPYSIQVQTDQCQSSARFFATRGLGSQNRLDTRVFSYSAGSFSSPLFESALQTREQSGARTSTNHKLTVRTLSGTSDIRNNYQLDCASIPRQRNASDCISGRLFNCQSKSITFKKTGCGSRADFMFTGLECEFQKVRSDTHTDNRISGRYMEPQIKYQIHTSRKETKNKEKTMSSYRCRSVEPQRCSDDIGNVEFCVVCRSQRAASLPPITESIRPFTETSTACAMHNKPPGLGRVQMVAERALVDHTYSLATRHSFFDHGRFRHRLGSGDKRRLSDRRYLEIRSKSMAQQSQGDVGNNNFHPEMFTSISEYNCTSPVRQQECSGLYPERGRTSFQSSAPYDMLTLSSLGREQNSCSSSLHPWSIQYGSGYALTTEISSRMDAYSESLPEDIQAVRHATNRPVCVRNSSCYPTVRLQRLQGSPSGISRSIQQGMALPESVDISSATSDPSGFGTSEQSQGNLFADSASMAQSILETRLEKTSHSSTMDNKKPQIQTIRYSNLETPSSGRPDESRGMVRTGWDHLLMEWTPDEVELLDSSWRQSTKKMYSSIWNKWQIWCQSKQINIFNPTGSQFAKYLAHLHLEEGLAYKTILVYKSAIATLTTPDTDSLSNNAIVKRILRAIALAEADKTPKKSVIWDPTIVARWLSGNIPDNLTLYEVSRRTALLLLLASSRRVHDLTLLHVDEVHFEDHSDFIILHPRFGSKTDNYTHRQSSWKLTKSNNSQICTVYWIKKLLEVSAERRNSKNLTELFITARGSPRSASRTVLGGWVRSLLRSAGVEASAGSTRCAAASRNWLDHCPIDEVMAKGNWKSPNTFARYYSSEIRSTENTRFNLSNMFQAV